MTKPKSRSKAATRSTARKTAKPASRKRPAPTSSKPTAGPDTKHARIIAMLRTPAGARNRRPDVMQKKRRNGRTSTRTYVEDEIAHLRGLDLKGLHARWQSVFRRHAPAHLTRHLLLAVIASRLQADRFGDLDHATLQVLDQTVAKEAGAVMSARLASFDQKRTELSPGTVLVREWDRRSQRVMVMADGFAWNGQTYDNLSKVAFAITGTRWNGPRFFGLRDKDDRSTTGPRP
jgi:hypothetical protein